MGKDTCKKCRACEKTMSVIFGEGLVSGENGERSRERETIFSFCFVVFYKEELWRNSESSVVVEQFGLLTSAVVFILERTPCLHPPPTESTTVWVLQW